MKRFFNLTLIVAFAVIVSACGAQAAPTPNPVDVQNTAVAAALTIVAQTQAAIPTNTIPPPTQTLPPTLAVTNTPVELPTLQVLASPTTAAAKSTTGEGYCDKRVLGGGMKGKPTILRIWNSTKTPVQISLYLEETAHNECGYRGYSLPKNGDVVFTDLVYGCYYIWAWNTSGKPNFQSNGSGCINNPDKWTFVITTTVIKFTGP